MSASIAENTTLTYQTAIRSFDSFRSKYGLVRNWPANVQHIVMFISFCFECGLLPSTISTYIAGISHLHKLHGWLDVSNVFLIRKVLEGCRRSRKNKDVRAPISLTLLTEICQALPATCYDKYEAKLFKAVFTLAFFGLFRLVELISKSKSSSTKALQKQDVLFGREKNLLEIKLNTFKTNQRGVPTILKIPCESNDVICPVCAVKEFLAIRCSPSGVLFVHEGGLPATKSQAACVLEKCLQTCKSSKGVYKLHSFRIGRATQLAAMGISGEDIMKLGRWRSEAYLGYIR